MRLPLLLALVLIGIVAVLAVRRDLYSIQKPGPHPRALVLADSVRPAASFDVVLPVVPVGMRRVRSVDGPLLIHYWAPWERHSRDQARGLDSLAQSAELAGFRVAMVCFDPFPSVARYVGRQRLRVPVLLDGRRELAATLPCPSLPYTYLIDRQGRIALAMPGEVAWWDPITIANLRRLAAEARDFPQIPAL
jgi:AhpC/TSA family protein